MAPIGAVPSATLKSLARFYLDRYGLHVAILPATKISSAARDAKRHQLVAEELIASMRKSYPKLTADPDAVVIGIVADDLYLTSRPDWAWAFGLRGDGRFAVISTARMAYPPGKVSTTAQLARLRKMVTKYIGIMYFKLPQSSDPRSVLYNNILGVDDLDRMGEEY